MQELFRQNITDYKLWDGVRKPSIKESINLAHKQIIEYAFENDLPEVCIAEDDFVGTHENSWRFFLNQKPSMFDIYLSSVFLGDIDWQGRVDKFTGLTLYIVSKKYYARFLSVPNDEHIDHALSNEGGDFVVCDPFTFIQKDGISGNTGKNETYGEFFKFRNLFGG